MSFVEPHVSDYNLNKKQQAWREICLALDILGGRFYSPLVMNLQGKKKKKKSHCSFMLLKQKNTSILDIALKRSLNFVKVLDS